MAVCGTGNSPFRVVTLDNPVTGWPGAVLYWFRRFVARATRVPVLTRVIRLYPLYFVGLAISFTFTLLQSYFGRTHFSGTIIFLTLLTSLLMIPAFGAMVQMRM